MKRITVSSLFAIDTSDTLIPRHTYLKRIRPTKNERDPGTTVC